MAKSKLLKALNAEFPYPTMRPLQAEALEAIASAFDGGKKFIVLELPTGVGKSAIGMATARAHTDAYYVTIQKLLQDQYISEFGSQGLYVLKGRNAYQCAYDKTKSCDDAACKLQPAVKKAHGTTCPYIAAVAEAAASPVTLFNLHSLYYQSQFGYFQDHHREVMVIDEAHKLETTFMGIYAVALRERTLNEPVPIFDDAKKYVPYLTDLSSRISNRIEELMEKKAMSDAQRELWQKLNELSSKIGGALATLSTHEWVVQQVSGGVDLKPLFVADEIRNDLFSLADRFVMMSATIIDIGEFCTAVGLKESEVEYIRAPSPFDVRNRPIVHYDVGSLSRKNWDENAKYMLDAITYILKKHKGQRGIIHTHSDKVAQFIADNLSSPRLTFKDGDVGAMLDGHKARPDSVIVASGLSEGLDLKDDLARFCIICKVPYPSLGDPQIKRRLELSRRYFNYLTVLKIVQEYGRTVRHEDDRSITYILDGDFQRLPEAMLPEWFREAIMTEEEADAAVGRQG